MRYLVKAKVKPGKEKALLEAIESGGLGKDSVAGDEYLDDMQKARLTEEGVCAWVEVCLCSTPLQEEGPYWEEFFDLLQIKDAHARKQSSSIAEGTQCGDCLEAAPAPPGTPDPVCNGSNGLDVAGLNAEGCYGYVDISWNPINDTLIRDFQGFRVLRREGPSWIGGTDETELTGADAAWLTTFRDATVEEGKSYSYRIMATDCYFEQHRGKAPADWPEAGNDPADNYGEAFAPNVSIGRPLLDPARPQVVTGLLGLEPPWFLHNPVSFWIRNASDAPLTLLALGASWENPEAYLERLVVGDGNTTAVTTAFEDGATPLTRGSGSVFTLNPTRLEAADDQIPFVNVFRNADRSVTPATDMRTNRIDYTLTYRNESTATEGCVVGNSVFAPLGPYVYSVTQVRPFSMTTLLVMASAVKELVSQDLLHINLYLHYILSEKLSSRLVHTLG